MERPSNGEVREAGPTGGAPRRLEPAGFEAELRRSYPHLWSIAAAVLNDRSQADDALQEAAMVGFTKLEDFAPGTNFLAWMGQIVRNIARNHARKAGRSPLAPTDPLAMDRSSACSEKGPLERSEELDAPLRAALESLGETARACLVLRTVQGLSYREIAAALDVPEGTAMSHVHRARAALRERLAPLMLPDVKVGRPFQQGASS